MPWDEAAAQETVAEFTDALADIIEDATAEELTAVEALSKLQALWQAAYMTSGHKRLARVFMKASID